MAKLPTAGAAKKPVEVEVANEEPLAVEVVEKNGKDHPPVLVTKGEGTTLAPTTTEADDKVTEGQRHISLVWEATQASISIAITIAVVYCQIMDIQSETLNNAFFFVIATYLQRTNHTRIGGVGPKANEEPYRGR